MMATLSQPATAEYYVMCQLSMRHPNEYYTGGAEPDGVWWNPAGLFGLKTGNTISTKDFYRLYEGYSPETGDKLTRNAGKKNRSAGELTVGRYCATTRHGKAGKEVVLADIMAGMWQHGESREGDPHLHTHCTILNLARSHKDGKFRALHQYPFYKWVKAAGAVYGSRLAWHLRTRLGIRMELHGEDNKNIRIANMLLYRGLNCWIPAFIRLCESPVNSTSG